MKSLLIICSLGAMISWQNNPNVEAIKKSIADGDVTALAKFFDDDIEVCILDEEDIYGIEAATSKVDAFFKDNSSKKMHDVHVGRSKGKEAYYLIGNLTMQTGEFRVYIYLREKSGQTIIEEIRFASAR